MSRAAQLLRRRFLKMNVEAKALGISSSHLSLLMAGKRKPSIEIAVAIEKRYGIPIADWVHADRRKVEAS